MLFAKGGCVYIMTNKMHSVLYVGVSSDLTARVWQHKKKYIPKALLPDIIATNWFTIIFTRQLKKLLPLKKHLRAVAARISRNW